MRIAILGATSQIAKDLVVSLARHTSNDLVLYARRTILVDQWLVDHQLSGRYEVFDFSSFGVEQHFDAILNFVGVGNPAQAQAMGESILSVTLQFDSLVLDYLRQHPACRYLFLSSGAAYGCCFSRPVDESSVAKIAINSLSPQDWYGIAKLYAECRHRAMSAFSIIDIRVFSYFSQTQDIEARFFISDALRAIHSGAILKTSELNIVRDYIGAADFYQLVDKLLSASPKNDVVDCYTRAPVDKIILLEALRDNFGLQYEITTENQIGTNATGVKLNYFSRNLKAARFGYIPRQSSLESILEGAAVILGGDR